MNKVMCGRVFSYFSDPCKAARCLYHALCVNKSNGSTACECPSADDCPDVVDRVCSSNGVTFDSECKMKAYSCDDAMNVTVKHRGECGKGILC